MALIVAGVVAAVLSPVAARVATRIGFVDSPGPHKPQAEAVPYLGGAAVFAAIVGPVAVARPTLLIPLTLAFALGLADDRFDLSAKVRLPVELVLGVTAALVLPVRGLGGALLTVAFVVVLLNAVNLIDGLDGLASGVCLFSALGFAVVLDGDFRVMALALGGALAGFLIWNRPPARIYLGDAGSYLAGTTIALLLAASFGHDQPIATSAGALLFVAVPVADTSIAIVRRLRAGRPLFEGDRGHVYDQLVDRGWSLGAAAGACVVAQAVLTALGVGIASLAAVPAALAASVLVVVAAAAAFRVFTAPGSWSA